LIDTVSLILASTSESTSSSSDSWVGSFKLVYYHIGCVVLQRLDAMGHEGPQTLDKQPSILQIHDMMH
jgi:hypothetical protein